MPTLRFPTSTILMFLLLGLLGCEPESNPSPTVRPDSSATGAAADSEPTSGNVSLEIHYGENSSNDSVDINLAWKESLTAFSVLEASGQQVTHTGSGESCFVSAINGIQNQGSSGPNWIFYINGELGSSSSDAVTLKPGDQVTWTFGDYTPNE